MMRHNHWTILATAGLLVLTTSFTAHAQYGGYGSGSYGGGFGSGLGGGRSGVGVGLGLSFGRTNYGGMGYGNNLYNTYGARAGSYTPFSGGAVNTIRTWPYPSANGYAAPGGMGGGLGIVAGPSYRTGPNVPAGAIYPTATYYSAYGQGPARGYYANYMNRGVAPQRSQAPVYYRRVAPRRSYYNYATGRYYYAR